MYNSWNNYFISWANGCNFPNDDLSSVVVSRELCLSYCEQTSQCTHFYWAKNTCFLKKNKQITKANAVNNNNADTLCGIVVKGNL